jgi:hypothetical protein
LAEFELEWCAPPPPTVTEFLKRVTRLGVMNDESVAFEAVRCGGPGAADFEGKYEGSTREVVGVDVTGVVTITRTGGAGGELDVLCKVLLDAALPFLYSACVGVTLLICSLSLSSSSSAPGIPSLTLLFVLNHCITFLALLVDACIPTPPGLSPISPVAPV